jgi:hypothetical protein
MRVSLYVVNAQYGPTRVDQRSTHQRRRRVVVCRCCSLSLPPSTPVILRSLPSINTIPPTRHAPAPLLVLLRPAGAPSSFSFNLFESLVLLYLPVLGHTCPGSLVATSHPGTCGQGSGYDISVMRCRTSRDGKTGEGTGYHSSSFKRWRQYFQLKRTKSINQKLAESSV